MLRTAFPKQNDRAPSGVDKRPGVMLHEEIFPAICNAARITCDQAFFLSGGGGVGGGGSKVWQVTKTSAAKLRSN